MHKPAGRKILCLFCCVFALRELKLEACNVAGKQIFTQWRLAVRVSTNFLSQLKLV